MMQWTGVAHAAAAFIEREQLLDRDNWARFVQQYREQPDGNNLGWRGEYWGKMMRGAALVYQYTQNQQLLDVLRETVKDMMTVAEEDGRVSTYSKDTQLDAWDLWCRKYVLLGNEYFLEICTDEGLKEQIIAFLCKQVDCILEWIGEGKQMSITDASNSWYGINSSSILEPVVRLYRLTGEKRYLDFATHIVKEGGGKGINIFELAYENKLYPYQYGVSKGYEMISCFEGLLEYYYATGEEKYRQAVVNFGRAVMDSELSVIGSCGITHELFDHTKTRQTSFYHDVSQETCVTVTWMKFCARLLELTGESVYADCMEQSFYNAYLGALNTEKKVCDYMRRKHMARLGVEDVVDTFLPFDSYSPLLPGRRGRKTGGIQLLSDGTYYGCCACIGSAGVGVFLRSAVMTDGEGIVINFFERGRTTLNLNGVTVTLDMDTDYPVDEGFSLRVQTDRPAKFTIKIRIPGWTGESGYQVYHKLWKDEQITWEYAMPLRRQLPESWTEDEVYIENTVVDHYNVAGPQKVYHQPEDDHFVALLRGPLTLAADSRTGKAADSVFEVATEGERCEDKEIVSGVPCLIKIKFADKAGKEFYLVDYASAGHDWQTDIAAWLPTK